jgi:hypothetical protein
VSLSSSAPTQAQCAANIVDNTWWGSNSGNDQDVTQGQHKGYTKSHGIIQFQLGTNVVLKGDHNKQYVTQDQTVSAHQAYGTQVQLGGNVVVEGDHNYQSLNQSQSIHAGYTHDIPQVQLGANVVLDGNWNSQSITQSQSTGGYSVGGVQQGQIAVNVVGDGNGNTQTINQTQN